MMLIFMDPEKFLGSGGGGGVQTSDQGGSDKVLVFQNPYPRKLRGGGGGPPVTPPPFRSVHG